MIKKAISKVKTVQGSGTFENANGVDLGNGKIGFFKFEYTFEDGESLTANHKGESFKVGDEVEYEIVKKHDQYGNSGRVKKPQQQPYNGGGSKRGGQSQAAFALSYAKDIYMTTTDNPKPPNEVVDDVTAMADGFLKWLNANQ